MNVGGNVHLGRNSIRNRIYWGEISKYRKKKWRSTIQARGHWLRGLLCPNKSRICPMKKSLGEYLWYILDRRDDQNKKRNLIWKEKYQSLMPFNRWVLKRILWRAFNPIFPFIFILNVLFYFNVVPPNKGITFLARKIQPQCKQKT